MTTAYSGDGITFPDNSVQATAPRVGMVNRIINGDMRISQRGTSFTNPSSYTLDRFAVSNNGVQANTVQQSATAPTGFSSSLVMTNTNSISTGTTNYQSVYHSIEGYNIADLNWGTVNAKEVTLSFWVRSSVTGTYGVTVRGGAAISHYVSSYSIGVADTWTYITLTVPGCQTDTWGSTNSTGFILYFDLGVGSTYSSSVSAGTWATGNIFGLTGGTKFSETNGATFYVTGVQLEKGSTATDFEYVDYGRQLQMCQRYYEKLSGSGGINGTIGNASYVAWYFKVTKRATPTMAFAAGSVITTDYISEDAVTGYRSGSYAYIVAGSTSSAEL